MSDTARLTAALAGRYRIERELGAGGMATVYLAQDLRHDRLVAIKVLRPELAAILGGERFLAEIKTTANLQHPHILSLFDSGDADGLVFYVMPYVEGESLRDRLTREKQLPVEDAVRIAREVADALEYAHEHGIVHRDIKPENILLHGGHALVADFGIALAASRSEGGTRMTETGMSLGTPQYMSPEQAMGERDIRAPSDIYALACVTYEMLMGEPPFAGPTAQAIIAKVMTDRPAPMTVHRPSIPPFVEAAVLTGLEKLAADRFATAAEYSAALGGATTARTALRMAAAVPGSGRWRRIAMGMGAVAVAALAVAVWALTRHEPRPTIRLAVAFPAGQQIRPASNLRLAISPDGSRIAYIGPDSSGGTQLWVRKVDELTARPLTGTSDAQAPFFSPDGRSIGYLTGLPGDLRVVSVDGGVPRTVVRDSALAWGGSWCGDQIWFTEVRAHVSRVNALGGPYEKIARLDTASGVTETDWAQCLPDPGVVLIQLWHSAITNSQLALLDVATGVATPLVTAVYGRYTSSGHLVYLTSDGVLHAARLDLKRRRLSGQAQALPERVELDVASAAAEFAVSDAGLLAYVPGGDAASGQLVWVDRAGNTTPVDTLWRGQFTAADLSPDGSRVAVASYGTDELQVRIKTLPAGPLSRLTGQRSNDRPAWMPDGRRLSFHTSTTGSSARTAMIVRADGSAPADTLVANARGAEETDFLPDGVHYLLRLGASAGGRDIVLGSLRDTVLRPLVAGPADEYAPAASPDGHWFAYVSNEGGRAEVYVRSIDDPDGGRTQVSVDGGNEPRWARSGHELYYRSRTGNMMAAAVTISGRTFTARPPIRLFSTSGMVTDIYHHTYSVARDGRFLMVSQSPTNGDLVLVFNWLGELHRGR